MKLLIGILSLCFLYNYSFAEVDSELKAEPETGYVVVKRRPHEIVEKSSEANRIGKKIDVHADLASMGTSHLFVSGIGIGLFLDRSKQVLVDFRQGRDSFPRSHSEPINGQWQIFEPVTHKRQASVHFKHFLGNSFYYRAGIDYNQVTYDYDYSRITYGSGHSSSFAGESLAADVTIGNQWQWQNFNLGCDWFGYAVPFYSRFYNERAPRNSDASYETRAFEEDKRYYVSGSSLFLLRLYMGASF